MNFQQRRQPKYGPRGPVAVFVDNPNILGGAYEHNVRIFYDQILQELKKQAEHVTEARFYSRVRGLGLSHTQFLESIKAAGYSICEPLAGRPKQGKQHPDIDCLLLTDLLAHPERFDTCVVLSGDLDYLHAFKHLRSLGKRVEVWAFPSNTSQEIQDEVDAFVDLRMLPGVCKPRQ
ncbi:NYN domain-containing protein [Nodosilinea sp. LEGE 07298]|uniref:NYN domain-containing protein n=1 Tax=Nodosilinea sp. LEGE 07298 TaxID=2777970 RepID=UPI001D13B7F0|nr:NYN domain-containing protein [Nodosilinea sp. LEGE 07298]